MLPVSSEISDLESFIDSYVTTDKGPVSPSKWTRTRSSEDGAGFTADVQQDQPYTSQNNGTEIWGKKPGGNEWHSPSSARAREGWNNRRPKIQDRLVQWQQSQPPPLVQADHPPPVDSSYMQQPQEPSNIQAIVTGLIRQNNMNKQNIPPWVDTSQPPPSFAGGMNQPTYQHAQQLYSQQPPEPNLYYDPHDPRFSGQEPILHSMTFQRADVNIPDAQFGQTQFAQPSSQASDAWGSNNYNPGGFYQVQQLSNAPHPQVYNQGLPPVNNPPPLVQSIPPFYNEQQNLDFHSEIMQGGYFEAPNNNPPPLVQAESLAKKPHEKVVSAESFVPNNAANQSRAQEIQVESEESKVQSKYPNSRLRSSRGSSNGDNAVRDVEVSKRETYQRQESEDVFENDRDDARKTQSQTTQSQTKGSNRKKPARRKGSAADEDTNWRKRDNSEPKQTKAGTRHNKSFDGETHNRKNNSSRHDKRERRDATPSSDKHRTDGRSKATSRANRSNDNQQRHLSDKRMGNVMSWLQNDQARPGDTVGQEIRRLKITDSEADLTRFIEMTQLFATNEAKMREVAEILCNKALKEPRFCRNAAILCDRMSFMMVQGTKFRSVVLNVMQGHYKNRDQLYASSYRKDRRWFGFATFLVEIFLNVRTTTRERLLVLTNPVFNCLFQVLVGNQIDQEHIECFGLLFERVGTGLEAENLSRLNELMAEIRDRCVISKSAYVKRILLRCVELYASKWKA